MNSALSIIHPDPRSTSSAARQDHTMTNQGYLGAFGFQPSSEFRKPYRRCQWRTLIQGRDEWVPSPLQPLISETSEPPLVQSPRETSVPSGSGSSRFQSSDSRCYSLKVLVDKLPPFPFTHSPIVNSRRKVGRSSCRAGPDSELSGSNEE